MTIDTATADRWAREDIERRASNAISRVVREADDARAEVKRLSDELVSERERNERLLDDGFKVLGERDMWRCRCERAERRFELAAAA